MATVKVTTIIYDSETDEIVWVDCKPFKVKLYVKFVWSIIRHFKNIDIDWSKILPKYNKQFIKGMTDNGYNITNVVTSFVNGSLVIRCKVNGITLIMVW